MAGTLLIWLTDALINSASVVEDTVYMIYIISVTHLLVSGEMALILAVEEPQNGSKNWYMVNWCLMFQASSNLILESYVKNR